MKMQLANGECIGWAEIVLEKNVVHIQKENVLCH